MLKLFLFLIFAAFSTLICEESDHSFQLANLGGDPSAIVGKCVNVISGGYFDVQHDLVMAGGQPLTLERK
ncbi:hypothetical protein PHSC3_000787 [Chlamydiales bacterium STE3]|nr:hypothetical protein PHSC3_000787 [Chlamydiales bacterium STE3]